MGGKRQANALMAWVALSALAAVGLWFILPTKLAGFAGLGFLACVAVGGHFLCGPGQPARDGDDRW